MSLAWGGPVPAGYTHLATVGDLPAVPVRRDGHHWVSAYQVHLGLWHAPRNVRDVRPVQATDQLVQPRPLHRYRYEV